MSRKELANLLREGPPEDDLEGQNKRAKFIQLQEFLFPSFSHSFSLFLSISDYFSQFLTLFPLISRRDQLEKMNDEQLIRFDFFMRSHFKKNKIKSLITSSLQPRFEETIVTDEIAIVVASLAKLYVGELVETGVSPSTHQPTFPSLPSLLRYSTATEILKTDKDEPPGLRIKHIL